MNIDSTLVIMLAEALGAVLVIAVVTLWLFRSKVAKERAAVDDFITHLKESESDRDKELAKFINRDGEVESTELNKLLKEINEQERSLYQKIIQIFLNRDCELLKGVDQYVKGVSQVYGKMAIHTTNTSDEEVGDDGGEGLKAAQDKITQFKNQSDRLSDQLGVAMSSMDEISAESGNPVTRFLPRSVTVFSSGRG